MSIIESLKDYTSCTIWLKGFKTKGTMEVYAIHLLLFCRFCALTPDQLIKIELREIKTMIYNYIVDLKKVAKQRAGKPTPGSLSVNSIKHYITGIQSFLDFHEIILPWKKIAKFYPEEVTNTFRGYTKEEIAKLLSLADLRDRIPEKMTEKSNQLIHKINPPNRTGYRFKNASSGKKKSQSNMAESY